MTRILVLSASLRCFETNECPNHFPRLRVKRIKLNSNSSPNPTSPEKTSLFVFLKGIFFNENEGKRERGGGSMGDKNTFYWPSTLRSLPKTYHCAESRWPHGFSPTLRPPAPPSSNSNWACLHCEFAIGQQRVTIGPCAVLTKCCHVNTALQVELSFGYMVVTLGNSKRLPGE